MTVNVCIALIASNRPHKKALGEIVRKQNALTIADTRVKEVNYHRRNDMIEDVSRKKKKKKNELAKSHVRFYTYTPPSTRLYDSNTTSIYTNLF